MGTSAPKDASRDDQASRLRSLVDRGDAPARGESRIDPSRADAARSDASRVVPTPQSGDVSRSRARSAPVVAIASGKGGVGKTNASVNLSIALTRLGKRTTLVDADIGTANADVLCGLSPKLRLERAVGADNVRALHEIAIDAPGGFRLVPGSVGIGRIGELDEGEQDELVSRLIEVERTSDIVLIDTSAGLGESVRRFIHAADLGIIVATPEPTSIADAYALIKVLVTIDAEVGVNAGVEKSGVERAVIERPNAPKLAVLLNQVANEREAGEVHGRIAGVCQRFLGYQLPMLGYIRKDKRVPAAVLHRVPVMVRSPRCHAAKDYLRTAEVLTRWSAG